MSANTNAGIVSNQSSTQVGINEAIKNARSTAQMMFQRQPSASGVSSFTNDHNNRHREHVHDGNNNTVVSQQSHYPKFISDKRLAWMNHNSSSLKNVQPGG